MTIRRATIEDIPIQMLMFDHSRSVMRAAGNTTQWTGYPTTEYIKKDIARDASYIICQNDKPVGTFAIVDDIEPTYSKIVRGRWIDNETSYATIHRLAALDGTKGIADTCLNYAKKQFTHLRADTHESNAVLRHILEKHGFVYCGIVFMDDDTERLAYEWWRFDEVPATLRQYVENEIIPKYVRFDAAHRPDHIRRVIARSMMLAKRLEQKNAIKIDQNMIYATAAMHDLGIIDGREGHHTASGRIIRADKRLKEWFSDEQTEQIAQAAEDHRASAKTKPRSLTGCIIAESDRDIEPETIVLRTMEYGKSHFPDSDKEGQWQRTLEHLHEKYDFGGYIKLWMDNSPNLEPLAELRKLIHDEKRLRSLFDRLWKQFL